MDAASTLAPELLAQLRGWEGRSETLHDEITAAPVRNLSATLDREDPEPVKGTELPPLWHWLYFLPSARQGELGPDLCVTDTILDVRSTASPTRKGASHCSRPPAHMRRGSGTGGRKPPRFG